MWCLVIENILLVQLKRMGYYIVGYADDLTIIINAKIIVKVTQNALKKLERWSFSNNFGDK